MEMSEDHVCYITNPHHNEFKQNHWDEKKEIKITLQDEPLIHLYDHREIYKRKVTLSVAEYLELVCHWESIQLHQFRLSPGRRIDVSSNVHIWLPGRDFHIHITNENVQRLPGVYLPFEKYRKLIKKQTFVVLPEEYYQLFIVSLPLLFKKLDTTMYDINIFHNTIDLEKLFNMRCYVDSSDIRIDIEQYLNSLPTRVRHALISHEINRNSREYLISGRFFP